MQGLRCFSDSTQSVPMQLCRECLVWREDSFWGYWFIHWDWFQRSKIDWYPFHLRSRLFRDVLLRDDFLIDLVPSKQASDKLARRCYFYGQSSGTWLWSFLESFFLLTCLGFGCTVCQGALVLCGKPCFSAKVWACIALIVCLKLNWFYALNPSLSQGAHCCWQVVVFSEGLCLHRSYSMLWIRSSV